MKKEKSRLVYLLAFTICLMMQGQNSNLPATQITVSTSPVQNTDTEWKQLFNFDWKFQLGDFQINEETPISDDAWRQLDLPHDYSIESVPSAGNPMGNDGGYFPAGVAWYQKHFEVPVEWHNRQIIVYFEGVYMNSDVYINGFHLGNRPYGYSSFSYDLTPHLNMSGDNTISVRVDNSQHKNSRWYSGSGIYRNVWLFSKGSVHVPNWGTVITTPAANTSQAAVNIKTTVKNITNSTQIIDLFTQIIGEGSAQTNISLGANSEQTIEQNIQVSNPSLWSPDTPSLYEAIVQVKQNSTVIDESEHTFGIRSIDFSAENGFLLNGKPVLISGGNVHHDNGCLGAAAYNRAEERRVQLLKDAGFNAVRTSHNPPSEAFLDACDRIGLLVIDESFDGWRVNKTPYDYARFFDAWAVNDVQDMVRRDQNHPSIIMWSIGNEIIERTSPDAVNTARMLSNAVKQIDDTRPVTSAMTTWGQGWEIFDPLMAEHDVCGYNYQMHEAESDHARVPDRIIFQSESYPRDAFYNWNMSQQHSYILGDFVWTAMDYLGESGIGRYYYTGDTPGEHWEANHFPWHGAYCGDIDLIGHRKPISYYREMLYNDTRKLYMAVKEPNPLDGRQIFETLWSVWPTWESWSWPGYEGMNIDVEVYSKYPQVRLYLNDVQVGQANTGYNQQFKATFNIPYQPGTLKAVGVEGGVEVEEMILKTSGEATQIRITADRNTIEADGQDLVFFTVELTDAEGNIQPDEDQKLVFNVEGAGEIIGVDNADLKDTDRYKATSRKTWKGRALVVVKSNKSGGDITLTVGSAALMDATLQDIDLSVSALDPIFDPEITDYTVYVAQGTTSIDITGIPNATEATVQGNGTATLVNGVANVSLVCTSKDGNASKTYNLNILEVDGTNYAMKLPGGNGYSSNVQISGLNLKSLPFTMELWFKPDGSQNLRSGLFFGRNPINNDNGGIQYLDNNEIIGMSNESADWNGINAGYAAPDVWHHVAFVVENNSRRIYLDGIETSQNDINVAVDYAASNVYIGFDNSSSDRAFKGIIDEVRVWNVALTQQTIENNALEVLNGDEANLIAYWHFDLPNSAQAVDMTNNHHGKITGGTYVPSFPRSNLKLTSLSVSDGLAYSENLDPILEEHHIFLPVGTTSVIISAETEDTNAILSGIGTVNVSDHGTLLVTVTSQDGLESIDYAINYIVDVDDLTLMHSYPFNDGTANDAVGTAHGTIINGEIADGYYHASNQGDYISLPGGIIEINKFPSITIEAKVNAGNGNAAFTMLSYFGNTVGTFGTDHYYTTLVNGGNSSAAISCGNTTNPWDFETRVNSTLLDDGSRYHLVSTLTNDAITWYINGVLAGQRLLANHNSIQFLSNNLAYLCKGGYTSDATWIGSIDEFNIYKGVMDSGTISTNANIYLNALSANDLETESFKLFPNPSKEGYFSIQLNPTYIHNSVNIKVYNILGKVVLNDDFTPISNRIEVNQNLNSGLYFVQIDNKETKKLMVK
ncbi:LamG-like jellyroll fold domain-containing protein [Tamlana flava]|uniref:LamG-like jellyroll fold domain-containing protein n=1 Tax=Tamlana flava TaxID=3158572 RepID=UPI00351B3BC1